MRNDFAVFICTHGRPNAQHTYNTLRKCGYTGRIYLVLDNTDNSIQEYANNFDAEEILIFDKNYYINSDRFDNGDNKLHAKCILYAKRAVEDIARLMNFRFFAIADDDIVNFVIRYPQGNKLATYEIQDFDTVLDNYISLLTDCTAAVGFGIALSYFKGIKTFEYQNLCKRILPYQFVIRNSSVAVNWQSWMCEDDITELQSSAVGNIWLSVPYVAQQIKPIGSSNNAGGMVEQYRDFDTYTLKFNIIKYCPRKTYISYDGSKYVLRKQTNNCFPKIISERFRNG